MPASKQRHMLSTAIVRRHRKLDAMVVEASEADPQGRGRTKALGRGKTPQEEQEKEERNRQIVKMTKCP